MSHYTLFGKHTKKIWSIQSDDSLLLYNINIWGRQSKANASKHIIREDILNVHGKYPFCGTCPLTSYLISLK